MAGAEPGSALDLGCGTGETLAKLKSVGIEDVAGIDCSEVALDEARKQLPDESLHCCDLNDAVFPAERQFDLIICKLTVAFVADKESFLNKVSALMHEKSVLCIITPVLHESLEYTKEDKPGIAVKYPEFKALLESRFGNVEELHHDYTGERGDLVTFLAIK